MNDYYDLGSYSRNISTSSPEAQLWFDRGLIWNYAYHHEEAIVCFKKALEHDKNCVMCHWGIAYASGPNYNKQWGDFGDDEKRACLEAAHELVKTAKSRLDRANDIERGLIEALTERYPDDPDVCTLFAESIMNRTPWQLWDLPTGKPAEGADTEEAIEVLETAFEKLADKGSKRHPGLLHMSIYT